MVYVDIKFNISRDMEAGEIQGSRRIFLHSFLRFYLWLYFFTPILGISWGRNASKIYYGQIYFFVTINTYFLNFLFCHLWGPSHWVLLTSGHPSSHLRWMTHLEETVLKKERWNVSMPRQFSGSFLHAGRDQDDTECKHNAQHRQGRDIFSSF